MMTISTHTHTDTGGSGAAAVVMDVTLVQEWIQRLVKSKCESNQCNDVKKSLEKVQEVLDKVDKN